MTLTPRTQSVHPFMAAAVLGMLLFATPKAPASPSPDPDLHSAPSTLRPQSIDQELKLAGDYLSGHGVAQDNSLAAYWYEKAAGAGDALAQLQTGYLYEAGIGVPRDPARAFHWYQLAAAGGLVQAKASLGMAYLWGTGVTKNEQMAAQLLSEAAAQGSGLADAYLGDMYSLGIGVTRDRAAAERWYMKGVKLHDPLAEFQMGAILFEDTHHAADMRQATRLLRESASAGFVPPMHLLGFLLIRNPSLAKSPEEAVAWLDESASAGMWRSSLVLGILARDGNGVPASAAEAYYHFRIAVLQGGDEANKFLRHDLDTLSADLGPGQVSGIENRARQWYQLHHAVLEFKFKEGENGTRFPAYALALPEAGLHAVQVMPTSVE